MDGPILAQRLEKGDTIGVFSPAASPLDWSAESFKNASDFFERKGFKTIGGSLTSKGEAYSINSPRAVAEEFNNLILNSEVKCILAASVGSSLDSVLPFIDYEAIKKHPKIIVGCSDVSRLCLEIYLKTGLVTFYGPSFVTGFGWDKKEAELSYEYFEKVLVNLECPLTLKSPLHTQEWKTHVEGKVSGRLIAASLFAFTSKFTKEAQDRDILVLESDGRDRHEVSRQLVWLNEKFSDKIAGVVFGRNQSFDDEVPIPSPFNIWKVWNAKRDFPVMANFNCLRGIPRVTLPIAVLSELDTVNKTLTLLEPWLRS